MARSAYQHQIAMELWNEEAPEGSTVALNKEEDVLGLTGGPAFLAADGIAVVEIENCGVLPLEGMRIVRPAEAVAGVTAPQADLEMLEIEGDMDARKPAVG